MARKTPEQLAQEFEGRKAKGLAKGAAAYWPNVMANAVLRLVAAGKEPSVSGLTEALEKDAAASDVALSAGASEALARLKQAVAKAS
jgi:hypothetical protein